VTVSADATVFSDVVAAEWVKVRTVRSTVACLAGAAVITVFGLLVLFLMIRSFDHAKLADQMAYESADPTVIVGPFVAFFLAAVGATMFTGEFGTRSIGPSLMAVPRRRLLLGSKAVVAAAVTSLGGLVFAAIASGTAKVLVGDRPKPINPWNGWHDIIAPTLSMASIVLVTGLVGVGLGALLRSTAATLLTMGALILLTPVILHYLPASWQPSVGSVLLVNLGPQLVGADTPYLLSPVGAGAVMALWVAVALTAGTIAFTRRDA
jgi:ABC-2 type transport system permease protein